MVASRGFLSSLNEQKEKGICVSQGRVEFEIADLELERLHCSNLYFSIICLFDQYVFGRYQAAAFNLYVIGPQDNFSKS